MQKHLQLDTDKMHVYGEVTEALQLRGANIKSYTSVATRMLVVKSKTKAIILGHDTQDAP